EPPCIARNLKAGRAAANNKDVWRFIMDKTDEAISCFKKIDDRFDGEDIVAGNGQLSRSHGAADVERNDVIDDLFPACEAQYAFLDIDSNDSIFDEQCTARLDQLPDVEADVLRSIHTRKHPGPHAGIVMVG